MRLVPLCVSGYTRLRLANGGEDRLHLNDVIIGDAASCNQDHGAHTQRERDPQRGALCLDRQAERGSTGFICLLSPSVVE